MSWFHIPRSGIVLLWVCILLVHPQSVCVAEGAEGDASELTLENLAAIDSLVSSGVTLQGTETKHVIPGDDIRPNVEYKLEFSWNAERHAVSLIAASSTALIAPSSLLTERAKRPFLPHEQPAPHGLERSPDGFAYVTVLNSEITYFDSDQSGKRSIADVFRVDQQGRSTSLSPTLSVTLSPAKSAHWSLSYKRVLWTGGRGFSKYITSIRSTSEPPKNTPSTLREVVAEGFDSEGMQGEWTLKVDTGKSFLVRHAEFRLANGRLVYSIENAGEINASGLIFAANGEFICHLGDEQRSSLKFHEAELKTDEDLLARGKTALHDRKTPGLMVTNLGEKTPIIYEIGNNGAIREFNSPKLPAEQSAPKESSRSAFQSWWPALLILNATFLLLFAGALIYRRYRSPSIPTS